MVDKPERTSQLTLAMKRFVPSQRGAIAVLVAILLVVIGAMAALAVNVGHLMGARNQLQNAVDSAALAGAMSLDGQTDGLALARAQAVNFGDRYAIYKESTVALDANAGNGSAGDVVLGRWNFAIANHSLAFTAADGATLPRDINAVLVRTGREASRGNPLPVFLSAFLGQQQANVRAEAVAVGGGPCIGCALPIAFPMCLIAQPDGTLNCGVQLRLSNANDDTVGLTSLSSTAPASVPIIQNILMNPQACSNTKVGDQVNIANGNNLQPLLAAFQYYLSQHGSTVLAPVLDLPCPPQFNQQATVLGFATFTIVDIVAHGNPKYIQIQYQCNQTVADTQAPAGCGFFGTLAPHVRLVRLLRPRTSRALIHRIPTRACAGGKMHRRGWQGAAPRLQLSASRIFSLHCSGVTGSLK